MDGKASGCRKFRKKATGLEDLKRVGLTGSNGEQMAAKGEGGGQVVRTSRLLVVSPPRKQYGVRL